MNNYPDSASPRPSARSARSDHVQPHQVLPSNEKMDSYPSHVEIVPAKGKPEEYVLEQVEIQSLIWDRDSHGLFDYESKQLEENRLTSTGCGMVVRDKYELKAVMPFADESEEMQKLFSLVYKEGVYWIYHFKSMFSKEKSDQLCTAAEFAHTD